MRHSKSSGKKPIEEVQSLRLVKPKLERFRRKVSDYNKIPAAIGAGKQEARRAGIEILGDIPWGTHICVFYREKQDLIDILVPYFKAGLENNEFCIWITSEPLNTREAEESLRQTVNNLSEYVEKGQIEILDHSQWYTKSGRFDADEVLQRWNEKYEKAVKRGFDGLRVTGNALWLEKRDWIKITRYEAGVNDIIGDCRILAICAYPLNKCGTSEAIDVVCSHRFALIRRDGRWELVESSALRNLTKALQKALEQWEVTFNTTQDSIMLVDTDFRVLKANLATSGLLGKTLDEILGSRCYELIHGTNVVPDMCLIKIVKRTKVREKVELHIPDKDIWVAISVDPILDEKGNVSSTVHIIRDTTEHKQMEKTLRESEQKYRALVEQSLHGIVILQDYRIVFANKAATEISGLTIDEARSLSLEDMMAFIPPENRDSIQERLRGRFAGKNEPGNYELRLVRRNGEEFWLNLFFSNIEYQGKFAIQLAFVDITNQKRMEEALRQSEKRFRDIVENTAVGVYRTTPDGQILMANPALVHMLGYSSFEELSQRNLEEGGFEPQYRRSMFRKEIESKGRIVSWESIWTTRGGKKLYVIENARAVQDEDGRILYYEGTAENITERKKAEEALIESEEKFRNLAEQSPNMIFINRKGRVVYANKECEEVMGYKREEFYHPDFDFMTLIAPEFRQFIKTNFGRHMKGEEIKPYEYGLITKDGERLDAIITTKLMKYGGEDSILGTITDITERKKAQEALKESEEKYRAIVERAPDGIVTVNLKGIITSCNTALLEQTGYSEQDFVGRHFSKNPTIRIKDIPKYLKIFGSLVAGKVPEPLEFVGIHKDGSEHWGEIHISIIKKRGKTIGFQAMTRDVTERKQAEEKLREYQEQLKSLASQLTLAEERERRRIATELHDEISQSLFISKMKLEGLDKSASDKQYDDTLDEINNSLGRIIAAMRSLTFDLSSPILYEFGFEEAVAEWLNEQVEKKYGIATEFEDDGLPKPLDDDIRVILFRNVRELLINVVKHARAKKIKVSIQKVGSRIRISVEDDGVGFDSAKAESLITSKEAFGLFSIRERLEHLGGNLEIKSSPGCGCRITITSPLSREKISKDK
jgi:PAS domain S-box-containing protein